jgi:hypothetical protein
MCREHIGRGINEIPVTVMGAEHRREKMLQAMRTSKYKLNQRAKKVGSLEQRERRI